MRIHLHRTQSKDEYVWLKSRSGKHGVKRAFLPHTPRLKNFMKEMNLYGKKKLMGSQNT